MPHSLPLLLLAAALSAPTARAPEDGAIAAAATAALHSNFSGAALIARGGRTLVSRAAGEANASFHVPNRLDTKFELASMNKVWTAIAVAQLVEQGKLSLDDTVAHRLPDYPDAASARKITLAQLLTHTSGLGDYFNPRFPERRLHLEHPADYYPLFAGEKLLFEPGKGWSYSNAGFILLGAIVERASGESYVDYLQRHVFAPAGMTNSGCWAIDDAVENRAVGYTRQPRKALLSLEMEPPAAGAPLHPNTLGLPLRGGPAGGCYSTAPDLVRFGQALLAGKLVKPETLKRFSSGQVDLPPPPPGPDGKAAPALAGTIRNGFGFLVRREGTLEWFGHSGGAPGTATSLRIYPAHDLVTVVLTNRDPEEELPQTVDRAVWKALHTN